MLAVGPCFTVRHWSVTQATVSLSSVESEAKAMTKGCIEALFVGHLLEHQASKPFKIGGWTDSSSAKAIMQRLGPGRLDKFVGMMGYTFLGEETAKFQSYTRTTHLTTAVFVAGC